MGIKPLPESFKKMIEKDLETCNQFIQEDYCTPNDVAEIIYTYKMYIPEFTKGITGYVGYGNGQIPNAIHNMKRVKKKLETILLVGIPDSDAMPTISISNQAIASASVTIDIKASIKQEPLLSEVEKSFILSKIDDLDRDIRADLPRSSKWDKAKPILSFFVDKGADLAIAYLPAILKLFS